MNQICQEFGAQGAMVVCSNGDAGDDNAAYVKPYFETSNFDYLHNAFNSDHPYGGEPSGNGALWVPFRLPSEGGIPFHVLFDMDGYCRLTSYGGYPQDQVYGHYLPFFKNLLGIT